MQRSRPMRFSAQRPSSIAWYGCMEAMTPSFAKRGMSAARRCCACSIRKRRSFGPFRLRDPLEEVEDLRVGAVADGVDHDLEPGPVGRRDALLHRESGIASAAHTPVFLGLVVVNGSKKSAVAEPSEPSENPLTPPIRSHSSFVIAARRSRAFSQDESDGR